MLVWISRQKRRQHATEKDITNEQKQQNKVTGKDGTKESRELEQVEERLWIS